MAAMPNKSRTNAHQSPPNWRITPVVVLITSSKMRSNLVRQTYLLQSKWRNDPASNPEMGGIGYAPAPWRKWESKACVGDTAVVHPFRPP
jgi:hypothetical protein